jgi:hypothetical protein
MRGLGMRGVVGDPVAEADGRHAAMRGGVRGRGVLEHDIAARRGVA